MLFTKNRMPLQKNKVLLLLKTPPPLTGATLMNSFVADSKLLKEYFNTHTIGISYKDKIEDRRIFSLKKISALILTGFKLVKSLTLFKPDQVYFQISPTGIAFFRDCIYILLIKTFRTPIIYHLHGKGILEYTQNSLFKTKIYKWAFKNASVICLSKLLIFDIENIFKGKFYILPNAIKRQEFQKRQESEKDIINILFLSNIIFSKGIIDFLDAFKLLISTTSDKDFKGYIVGKEVDLNRETLEKEIQYRRLNGKVVYLGAKYDNEKSEILNKTHILVHPTLKDVWGLVILEAMQASIPVIATKEGAIPEIIDDGITGFLVEKNNPQQIAEKIEILISNSELRKKMGEAGRKKFLERYTLDIFEENLVNVLKNILENNVKKNTFRYPDL